MRTSKRPLPCVSRLVAALFPAEALRTFSDHRRGPIFGEISVIKTHLCRGF